MCVGIWTQIFSSAIQTVKMNTSKDADELKVFKEGKKVMFGPSLQRTHRCSSRF